MAEPRVERRLAAILAADVAGYSRLMGADEEGTLLALKACRRELIDPKIAEHRGRMVKTTGDGALVEFASAVDATRCAVEIQRAMAERNAVIPEDRRVEFRIGINVGDIIIDERDIFGDGVNVAARLEGLAEPGGICVSGRVHEDVQGKLDIAFEDAGERQLKNILRPIRVFRVQRHKDAPKGATPSTSSQRPSIAVLPFQWADRPSIAVLPFVNMSGDAEQEYFADGITEDIITALSKWRWFLVIARNSSFAYKGRAVDAKQVGRELGVRYLLEGSIRRAGNRIRVTAQLIDATNGIHIWAERFDRDLIDVFAIQDELTQHVVAAIEPALSRVETERAKRKTPEQMLAWDHYLRGMWHFHNLGEDEATRALAAFEKAIELDQTLADAHAGIARTILSGTMYWAIGDRQKRRVEVFTAAKRALALDSENITAHYVLSIASSHNDDPEAGFRFAQRAIQLNDNFALGYFALSVSYLYLGRPDDALIAIDHALRLSPSDPQAFFWCSTKASALYLLGRYLEALDWARQSLGLRRYHTALRVLAASCARLGRIEEAGKILHELLATEQADKTIAAVVKPFRRAADQESYAEALRIAGMPEE
jgi:adenylate cyclase